LVKDFSAPVEFPLAITLAEGGTEQRRRTARPGRKGIHLGTIVCPFLSYTR
jgi:hypothetical protein